MSSSPEAENEVVHLLDSPKDVADLVFNAMYANLIPDKNVQRRKFKPLNPSEIQRLFHQSSYSHVLFQSTVVLYWRIFNMLTSHLARFKLTYQSRTELPKSALGRKMDKQKAEKLKQEDDAYISEVIRFALQWLSSHRDARTGQPPPLVKVHEFLGTTREYLQSEFRPQDMCWNCYKSHVNPMTGEAGLPEGKFCTDCGAPHDPNSAYPYVDLIKRCETELRQQVQDKKEDAPTRLPSIDEHSEAPVQRHFRPCNTCGCKFEQEGNCFYCSEPFMQPWYKIDSANRKRWTDQHRLGCVRCIHLAVGSTSTTAATAGDAERTAPETPWRPELDSEAASTGAVQGHDDSHSDDERTSGTRDPVATDLAASTASLSTSSE